MLDPIRLHRGRAVSLALLLTLCTVGISAQDSPVYDRTRALDESHSQAERQAEQMVSLSAEKLITLLQKETGLLLEVKKLLVRKAFEQGRILEPNELTDEALFRLLREDQNIRVLATQEVSKRLYIRALPTEEERRRELALHGPTIPAAQEGSPAPETSDKTHTPSQEERYWSDQERRVPLGVQPAQSPYNPPYGPQYNPQTPEGSPGTQSQPEFDSRRALEQAQMQDSDDLDATPGSFGSGSMGLGSGSAGAMERISPEDLPGLIRARSEQQISPGAGGTGSDSGQAPESDSSRMPSYPSQMQPGAESGGSRTAGVRIRAHLVNALPWICGGTACIRRRSRVIIIRHCGIGSILTLTFLRFTICTRNTARTRRNWFASGMMSFAMAREISISCQWTFRLVRTTCWDLAMESTSIFGAEFPSACDGWSTAKGEFHCPKRARSKFRAGAWAMSSV